MSRECGQACVRFVVSHWQTRVRLRPGVGRIRDLRTSRRTDARLRTFFALPGSRWEVLLPLRAVRGALRTRGVRLDGRSPNRVRALPLLSLRRVESGRDRNDLRARG